MKAACPQGGHHPKLPTSDVQTLSDVNKAVRDATAAAAAAEKKLAALEVGIPKARMEADSQRQLAQDLRARLTQLKAATKVFIHHTGSLILGK